MSDLIVDSRGMEIGVDDVLEIKLDGGLMEVAVEDFQGVMPVYIIVKDLSRRGNYYRLTADQVAKSRIISQS